MGITSPLSDSIMEVMGLLLWIDHCLTPNVISGPPTQADEAQLMCQQFFFFYLTTVAYLCPISPQHLLFPS